MKRIIRLDATALSQSNCMLRLYYFAVKGYTKEVKNVELVFGVAFHRFAELLESTGNDMQAMMAARKYFNETPKQYKKTNTHLDAALLTIVCEKFAHEWYPQETFKTALSPEGKKLVELKFAIPFWSDEHSEVLLCGTMDRVGRIGTAGIYCIPDFKTTSSYDSDAYLQKYELSGQLLIYQWAVRWYAKHYPDSIFAQMLSVNGLVGSRIDGIFLNKDTTKIEYKSSRIFVFTPEQIESFEQNVLIPTVKRAAAFFNLPDPQLSKEGVLNGSCDGSKFGACDYFRACAMPSPEARDMVLSSDWITKEYNPLKFNE